MAPPRTYRCEAIILSYTPLGEADLLVTMYTRDQGKVRAVGKGARRLTSKLVGHLEPLTVVKMSMAHGRSMDIISQAEVIRSFSKLKEDLMGITKGLYLAELVDGFGSEDQANPALYHLALNSLHAIAQNPDSELPLRYFELRLLMVSGLMPELYHCVECRQSLKPGAHRFSPNVGGVICLDCNPEEARMRPLSVRALKVLRLFHRGTPAQAHQLRMDPALAQELKTLLASAVSYWLEREIRSNSLIEHLQRNPQTKV